MQPLRALALPLLAVLATGCTATGSQDVLAPAGPQAAGIARWFWISFWLAVAVFVVFSALLAVGLRRAHGRARRGEANELSDRAATRLVAWGGLVIPAVILLVLLVLSGVTDRGISALGRGAGADPLTIRVTGHQFWWELEYLDPRNPHRTFTTANELHVPAGRPVRLLLESADVVHSFWVPNLHGKTDLVPGRTNDIVLQADTAGIYRGQCAEFCGVQHAKMAMLLVAHPERDFAAWWERQLRPHAPPADPALQRGQQVFMGNGCAVCHSIRGTEARGRVAPDLTYLGDRLTLAAGTLGNTRGHLMGWIANPQGIKPGTRMPAVPLGGQELQLLADYLHSLR